MPIDPRTDAVRPDLADVRLADRVFAPHYAAPMARKIVQPVAMRATPAADSDVLTELGVGDDFEILELTGTNAWGVAPATGLVGYITAGAVAASEK